MFGNIAITCCLLCMAFLVPGPALGEEGAASNSHQAAGAPPSPADDKAILPGQGENKQAEAGEKTTESSDAPKGSDAEGSDAKGSDAKGSDAEGSDAEGSDAEGSDEVVAPEDLKQRVMARWAAMIDKNFHRAYEFCSPAYRALFTPKQFAARLGSAKLIWQRVDIVSIKKQNSEGAKVNIRIFAEVFMPDDDKAIPTSTISEESWIRSGDEWWYVPD
jgi:hypothetical protein